MKKSFGKIAYEAFTDQAKFHTSKGKSGSTNAASEVTAPEHWEKLPLQVRDAWTASAAAVVKATGEA